MKAKLVQRLARAKINLTLHVTGQRADGYHLLDSLVCFAGIGDQISVERSEHLRLSVDGPLAKGVPLDERNLVWQAALLFERPKGAHISLSKHLPNAAGIGGGSADAAATLLALAELWDVALPLNAVELGADVPVCLSPGAVRMSGVGETLNPVPPLPPIWAVLVNPRIALETPLVFKALSVKENSPMDAIPEYHSAREVATWCSAQRNDLQAPAISLVPQIQHVLNALEPSLLARMSGSGATCFGLCESAAQADALAVKIQADHPDWWIKATTLS